MDAEAIAELFEPVARVRCRRMFGGHGVYVGELFVALEADGIIYLKCDAATRPAFDARGLRSFTYVKQGQPTELNYREAPASAWDDAEELRVWLGLAEDAARRGAERKAAQSRRKRALFPEELG